MKLHRDSQQWLFDWVIKETGRVYHFQAPGRGPLPPTVKSHQMISKHVGRAALQLKQFAEEAEAAGNKVTALEHYYSATLVAMAAQHTIFENNQEKQALHAAGLRMYEKVRMLAPYRVERVSVSYRDGVAHGYLHLVDGSDAAPCVVLVPGCDMTKEMVPHPLYNPARQRGMNILVIDGPGQAESNLAGVPLRADNYELAVSAFVDALQAFPQVDMHKVGLYGMSYGSRWAVSAAAADDRFAGCVASWASLGAMRHLMESESPRYKQLFAYLTQAGSEIELDEIIAQMDIGPRMAQITCPTLLTVGEYDPRSPLGEITDCFDAIKADKEMWIFEDQHHMTSLTQAAASEAQPWLHDSHSTSLDWLQARFDGKPVDNDLDVKRFRVGGPGPNGHHVRSGAWFEAMSL